MKPLPEGNNKHIHAQRKRVYSPHQYIPPSELPTFDPQSPTYIKALAKRARKAASNNNNNN